MMYLRYPHSLDLVNPSQTLASNDGLGLFQRYTSLVMVPLFADQLSYTM